MGTILYHEPQPQQGLTNRKTAPITQVFTTTRAQDLVEETPYQAFSGTVGGVEGGRDVDPRQWQNAVQRLFARSRAGSTRVLPPERFRDLWRRLSDEGIFELPRHRGKARPEEEPYFLLQARGLAFREWVFVRPSVELRPRGDKPGGPGDPGVAEVKVWNQVKYAFFDFVNER
ncbi:MAG: hypothetical protein HY721_02585 [Planctomycetes bacterium]|nr:hypothetical protein [Planctomycetota bacterium]